MKYLLVCIFTVCVLPSNGQGLTTTCSLNGKTYQIGDKVTLSDGTSLQCLLPKGAVFGTPTAASPTMVKVSPTQHAKTSNTHAQASNPKTSTSQGK